MDVPPLDHAETITILFRVYQRMEALAATDNNMDINSFQGEIYNAMMDISRFVIPIGANPEQVLSIKRLELVNLLTNVFASYNEAREPIQIALRDSNLLGVPDDSAFSDMEEEEEEDDDNGRDPRGIGGLGVHHQLSMKLLSEAVKYLPSNNKSPPPS
jgi:hypothetical protein